LRLSRPRIQGVEERDRLGIVARPRVDVGRRVGAESTPGDLSPHLRKVRLGRVEVEDAAANIGHFRREASVRRQIRTEDRDGPGASVVGDDCSVDCWPNWAARISGKVDVLANEIPMLMLVLLLLLLMLRLVVAFTAPLHLVDEALASSRRLPSGVDDQFRFGVRRSRLLGAAKSGKVPTREERHRVLLDRVGFGRVLLLADNDDVRRTRSETSTSVICRLTEKQFRDYDGKSSKVVT